MIKSLLTGTTGQDHLALLFHDMGPCLRKQAGNLF